VEESSINLDDSSLWEYSEEKTFFSLSSSPRLPSSPPPYPLSYLGCRGRRGQGGARLLSGCLFRHGALFLLVKKEEEEEEGCFKLNLGFRKSVALCIDQARESRNKKMDASSRVIAVLVSTLDGSVVYERFWTRLSELERADLRAAAAATAAELFAERNGIAADGREAVGRHR